MYKHPSKQNPYTNTYGIAKLNTTKLSITKLAMALLLILTILTSTILPSTRTDATPQPTDVPEYEFKFGQPDPNLFNSKFAGPSDVATDSSGNIYVADTYNSRIQKFDSNGTYMSQWGTLGIGDGQLSYPEGITVDSTGNVYVADTNNSRIQERCIGTNER